MENTPQSVSVIAHIRKSARNGLLCLAMSGIIIASSNLFINSAFLQALSIPFSIASAVALVIVFKNLGKI